MSSRKTQITLFLVLALVAGNTLAQSLIPIDPGTVTDGHVYLLEDETDSSANSNTGVIAGAPQVVDGLSGKAMQFNGTSDGIQPPNIATINLGTHQNKTVIAVFKCADVSKPAKQVVFEEGGTTRGMNIYVSEGLAYAGGWNPADYSPQWPGTFISAPIKSNEWHVVVAVLRGGGAGMEDDKFEMWMDGVLIGKGPGAELRSRSNNCGIGYQDSQTKFHDGNVSATGSYFEGVIDEVWILNYALTEAELADIAPNITGAKDPIPDKDTEDVLRDGLLSWTPGKYAVKHHIYFGDVFEDVNTATTPSAVLDVNTYDPGRMEFGKTYYWRVDEVNGAPDNTVFKGDVWNFQTEPHSIMIPVDVNHVTASSSTAFNPPSMLVNGSGLDGMTHGDNSDTMWLSDLPDLDPWFMVEFDRIEKLDRMLIWNYNTSDDGFIGWSVKDAKIEYSIDGENWTTFAESASIARAPGKPTYDEPEAIDFGMVPVKYVRVNILGNWGGILKQYGLAEVQFYGVPVMARTPDPASGSLDVLPDAVATWRAGLEVGHHAVYLSPDLNVVADGSVASISSNANSLDLAALDLQLGQTYYWRVDEVNEAEAPSVWAGDVWNFSTVPYLTVDDFEGYDNKSPNRPFQAWLDGFGYSADEYFPVAYPGNGTGSGVGHDIWSPGSLHFDGDIMETRITMEGSSQSMPFYYDNSAGTGSSEITAKTADLPVGQDWSRHGIQTLTLHFRADSLSEALDTTFDVTTQGDALWFSQDVNAFEDGDAARSGALGNNVQSSMQTTVEGPGTVSFYWKVSSEVDWDFLDFYIDDVMQEQISGEVDWEQKTYQITGAGSHTLEWRYTKDQAVFGGLDCGWIDKLEWTGGGQPTTAPGNTGQLYVKVNGTKVTYPGRAADVKWAAWKIDLASLGVDLQNVQTLTIGVDGAGASGLLYLDNFRLEAGE